MLLNSSTIKFLNSLGISTCFLYSAIEAARAAYLQEKGESQDATKSKDAAFAKLEDWMSEFYAVARIGLEDKPQLLEALGKVVRS